MTLAATNTPARNTPARNTPGRNTPARNAPATNIPATTAPVAPAILRPLRTEPEPRRRTTGTTPLTLVPGSPAPGSPPVAETGGAPPGVPHLRLLRHEPEVEGPDDPTTVRAACSVPGVPDDLRGTTELRRRAHQVLSLVLEAVGGRRPLGHVAPHLDPRALRYVRAALARPAYRPTGRLTSLHVCRPCPGAVEVAAVHRVDRRTRVVAARFEGNPDTPGRWRCVTLRLL